MKRAYLLLAVPAAALVVAVLGHREPAPPAPVSAPAATTPRTASGSSTWVATLPARTTAHAEAPANAAPAPRPKGPKPPTESRTALLESRVPVLPAAALTQIESPRERLLAAQRGPSEARQAQLDRLGDRADAQLSRLKTARAAAHGEDRARIDRAIAVIQRNQTFRAKIMGGRTAPAGARAGTAEGPVPQHEKP